MTQLRGAVESNEAMQRREMHGSVWVERWKEWFDMGRPRCFLENKENKRIHEHNRWTWSTNHRDPPNEKSNLFRCIKRVQARGRFHVLAWGIPSFQGSRSNRLAELQVKQDLQKVHCCFPPSAQPTQATSYSKSLEGRTVELCRTPCGLKTSPFTPPKITANQFDNYLAKDQTM